MILARDHIIPQRLIILHKRYQEILIIKNNQNSFQQKTSSKSFISGIWINFASHSNAFHELKINEFR